MKLSRRVVLLGSASMSAVALSGLAHSKDDVSIDDPIQTGPVNKVSTTSVSRRDSPGHESGGSDALSKPLPDRPFVSERAARIRRATDSNAGLENGRPITKNGPIEQTHSVLGEKMNRYNSLLSDSTEIGSTVSSISSEAVSKANFYASKYGELTKMQEIGFKVASVGLMASGLILDYIDIYDDNNINISKGERAFIKTGEAFIAYGVPLVGGLLAADEFINGEDRVEKNYIELRNQVFRAGGTALQEFYREMQFQSNFHQSFFD